MDPLDRLIQLANLQGRLDQRCQLQGSWALEHPQAVPGEATFHIVMAGTCYCEFLDGGRLDLHPGDLILLPRGTPHLLRSDSPAQPCEPTVEHRGSIPLYQLNGPGEALDMLCGSYRYHAGASLFGALPERLLVHMDESTQQPLRALIGLMREEAESTRSGARSIIDALATALFALACAPTWTANRWATACSACWATPAWDEPCGPCWNARSMPGPWNSLPSRRRCRGPVSSAPSPPSAGPRRGTC